MYLRTKPDGLESHGVKFNPDGTVANYFEVFGDKQAQLQAMVDKYNRLTTKDAQDAYKKSTLDPAKESYEKFKKDFEKYEEIINKDIPGLEEDLKENLKRQIETSLFQRLLLSDGVNIKEIILKVVCSFKYSFSFH